MCKNSEAYGDNFLIEKASQIRRFFIANGISGWQQVASLSVNKKMAEDVEGFFIVCHCFHSKRQQTMDISNPGIYIELYIADAASRDSLLLQSTPNRRLPPANG